MRRPLNKGFLSTLPARGATLLPDRALRHRTDFYPRSPRGERLGRAVRSILQGNISIHAPREGSDLSGPRPPLPSAHFYPRSPRGERPGRYGRNQVDVRIFLSTLPARGATVCFLLLLFCFMKFLSTLPARGATPKPRKRPGQRRISIHAPREGSDAISSSTASQFFNFYPRSPRGERPLTTCRRPAGSNFYPRSPRGERR